jgi:Zn-dependent protease with chaperone function
MATDFYERQYQARQSTKRLVVLFVLGVAGIVGTVTTLGWFGVNEFDVNRALDAQRLASAISAGPQSDLFAVPALAGAASLALIGGGTLYKTAQLSGGGHVVAESLGGKRLFPDTTDPVERRVLNVVEEMALASGVPVPPVFLLPGESAINAFAAGYSPSDAVVAVTRGCAEKLTRDQLQGVVAHEFSHILNGDMRLNIRLIGVLYGILILGLIGRIILRMVSESRPTRRSSNEKEGKSAAAVFLLIGAVLAVLGYLGTLFGGLIKAAASRQREYLADASAVQFTRNPDGLAGALKRIGAEGATAGSRLVAANAAEASHMYFAQGVWEGFTGLTATHPPLTRRIQLLDPAWDGTFPAAYAADEAVAAEWAHGDQTAGIIGATKKVPVAVVARAADQVGDPSERHRQYAAKLLESLPPELLAAAREPYGARAVLMALLVDRDAEVRAVQLAHLAKTASADVHELVLRLLPVVATLDVRCRLPLVDVALPALRAMSPPQYREFVACFKQLVAADQRLGLFEWTLHRILLRHLQPQFEKTAAPRAASADVRSMAGQCSTLLSTLAHADNRTSDAPRAVERGAACLPGVAIELLPPDKCGLDPLSRALDDLRRVAEKQRRHVVNACAATICADREVTVAEAELLRGVCDMLDCPMPPLLPGSPDADGAGKPA